MGRNASISTQAILDSLPDEGLSPKEALINRIQDMFRSPNEHVGYLKSEQFAKDLIKLNKKVRGILEDEPRCVFLQSPAYVFGDIHGNLEDLHFFSDNIWNLGMALTAGNFVFLGDYVDRGMSCLEVVAYLLAMKLMLPHKVFLLRGNHETRDVNGWEEHYGTRSFIHQCRDRFGDDLGYKVWEITNSTFDRMPLSAVIDQDIFCVHGGIPRPVSDSSIEGGRIKDILNVSKVAGINPPVRARGGRLSAGRVGLHLVGSGVRGAGEVQRGRQDRVRRQPPRRRRDLLRAQGRDELFAAAGILVHHACARGPRRGGGRVQRCKGIHVSC
jgi:hypothetical protein